MTEGDGVRAPLLASMEEGTARDGYASPVINYTSINAKGPQFCYSPFLSSTDVASRDQTPTNHRQEPGCVEELKVYRRRWYILLLYSLLACTQSAVWNTFSPISSTVEDTFGWKDSTIALFSNWGPISYLLAGVFFSWVLDVKGLRLACLLTAVLVAAGTGIRCISVDPPTVTWLMNVGQALNGLAGPVAMAGPPAVSAVWFPPHERTTATAIGALFTKLGTATGFIIGPLLVPDVPSNSTNRTATLSSIHPADYELDITMSQAQSNLTSGQDVWTWHQESEQQRISKQKKSVRRYMYIEAGWSLLLLILIVVYFPKKPPLPPCVSANIQRESFFRGLKQLFKRPQFWLVCTVYGISTGIYNVWAGVLDVILKPHGIGEKEAGWIGFYAIVSAGVVSVIVARFADVFSRIMKWLVFVFYVIGIGAFVVFTLSAIKVIPPSTALFYTTIIVGTTAVNAAVPLMFELACELAYPTGEGTTNGVLTIVNNFVGLIFLFVFMAPHIGSMWTNWTLLGAIGVCLPLLLMLREQYNRLEIDQNCPSLSAHLTVPLPVSPDVNDVIINTGVLPPPAGVK